MQRTAVCALALLALVLAACSTKTYSTLPVTGNPALVIAHRHERVGARFIIRIPRRKRHRRKSRYVSPSTRSLAIAVDGGKPAIVNLTGSSSPCTPKSGGGYSVCTVVVTTTEGRHVFSVIAYDLPDGLGVPLSANTHVPFDVEPGTTVSLILGGIVSKIAVAVPALSQLTGTLAGGFTLYGNIGLPFSLTLQDADGNTIVGPGTPAISVTPPASSMSVATPGSGSSTWTLTSTYQAANPLTPANVTVTAVATPLPDSGGSTVSMPLSFTLYQPWIYVTRPALGQILAFDLNGNQKLTAATFAGLSAPTGIAFDQTKGLLYVVDSSANTVLAYDPVGTRHALTGGWAGLSLAQPQAIALDPASGLFYVTALTLTGVTAYDQSGTQQLLGNGFLGVGFPNGIAYDAHNGSVYVTDGIGYTFNAFTSLGIPQTLATPPAITNPNGIVYDAHNGLLYVAWGNGSVQGVSAFDEDGTLPSTPLPAGAFPGLAWPAGIAYDPYDQLIFVADQSTGTVRAYTENGTPSGSAFASGASTLPPFLAIVP